ncbi:hypothetical protein [Phenylobacterium sp.]|uniref:hypothetical protein n=1 Tax=Phenylobacterium sp. TaxID=1871053 RepID=UPI0035AEFFF8
MSLVRLIMAAGQPPARFIAQRSGGPSSTGFTLPASGPGGPVLVGDFLVVEYYGSYTLSGGSGSAFTTLTFSNTKVSYRRIEAGDLTTPFTLSSAGPYLLMIVRGPSSLGAAVRSGTLTGDLIYPTEIAGITPTVGAIGIMGFANVTGSGGVEVYYHAKNEVTIPGPFDTVLGEPASTYGYAMGVIADLGLYAGAPFSINTEDTANTITYRIHELF